MRILHVITTLDPATGGVAEIVRVLLNYGPEDASQEVVTLDDPDAPFLREIRFSVHGLGPRTSTYGRTNKLIPWLEANRSRFDGVVLHGMWQFGGYAVWKTMGARVPYVVFTHGMLDPYFKHAFPVKHLKKWAYWLPVEYWVLRGAYRVLFTCDAEATLAKQSFWLHRWKAQVVPFGTIPPSGDPVSQREAFFGLCPAVRGRRFLLFLGRIDRKKGCDLLVDAFVKLAARDPELPLSVYMHALGGTGITAYGGLLEIGRLKAAEQVFVSTAGGAVGSVVAQIALLKGCYVVGSTGSEEKAAWLRDVAGLNAAVAIAHSPRRRSRHPGE